MDRIRWLVATLIVAVCGVCAYPVNAQVLMAQDEALHRAFPEATSVKRRSLVLTAEKIAAIERADQLKLKPGIITYFTGYRDAQLLGIATIDSGVVRTHQAVFMSVFTPEGILKDVFILAFHEPPEYIPSEGWFKQFHGKKRDEPLLPGKDIAGVMGSTLSVQAIAGSIRRMQTLFPLFTAE